MPVFSIKSLIKFALYPETCIWVDVLLVKETPKAILIAFDGRQIWLPKAWILRVKRGKNTRSISIKISEYHWANKT